MPPNQQYPQQPSYPPQQPTPQAGYPPAQQLQQPVMDIRQPQTPPPPPPSQVPIQAQQPQTQTQIPYNPYHPPAQSQAQTQPSQPVTQQQVYQPYPQQPAQDQGPQSRFGNGLRLLVSWGGAIILALIVQAFAFQSYRVFGKSMEPTLQEGNYLIISKLGSLWSDLRGQEYIPERGDIIVLNSPSGIRLVKRVIGMPGEFVDVRNGEITIYNDEYQQGFDPYEALNLPTVFTEGEVSVEVPEGHIFVVGDNRLPGGSSDSRNDLGPVSGDEVIGKLILRLWPLNEIDRF